MDDVSDFAPLLAGVFRASPDYELVVFDRLTAAEREMLAELRREPGFYGVLRPRPEAEVTERGALPRRGLKSVDRDTALLLLTLAAPAPLPGYVHELFGSDTGRAVARLVADGVLEVDAGAGFVSGAAALRLLVPEPGAARRPPAGSGVGRAGSGTSGAGRIAALSRAALQLAQELPLEDPSALAARIYGYHRRPLTPRWQRLMPDAAAHARYLGLARGGAAAAALGAAWTPLRAPSRLPAQAAWLSWRPRAGGAAAAAQAPGRPIYKLYISPDPDALAGSGFAAIVAALPSARTIQLKVGADAAGLLRPDKIVAYFPDLATLGEAAERLGENLAGLPAHGVPFTAEIGGGGLLSWGVDPAAGTGGGLPWLPTGSWRQWLSQRLARAILAAGSERGPGRGPEGSEPWRFALARVGLEGIDTETWTPRGRLFEEEG